MMINKNSYKISFIIVFCLFLGVNISLAQSKIPPISERIEPKRDDLKPDPRMQIRSQDELFKFLFPGSQGRPNAIRVNSMSSTNQRTSGPTLNNTFTSQTHRLPSDLSVEEAAQQEAIKNPVKTGTTKESSPNGSR